MALTRLSNFTLGFVSLLTMATAAACSDTRQADSAVTGGGSTSVATVATVDTLVDDTATAGPATTGAGPTTTLTPSVATICIRSNIDFAALRSAPDRGSELLAEIPPGACDVFVLDLPAVQGNGFDWYHVQWNGVAGFTAADNAESFTRAPGQWDIDDPDFFFLQIANWGYTDLGYQFGEFSNEKCETAFWANFAIEGFYSDDVDAAIAGLDALSIPISAELRLFIERAAVISRTYEADFQRISNKYAGDGEYSDEGAAAAKADPAYAGIVEDLRELYTDAPGPNAIGSSLIDDLCAEFRLED